MVHKNHLKFTSSPPPHYLVKLQLAASWSHCLRWYYIIIMVIIMVFTKEDKLVMKFLRETKHYGAKRFLLELTTKP